MQELQSLQQAATGFGKKQLELIPKAQLTMAASYQNSFFSRLELVNFYGIELDDFAHEVAILSLWLAQHQLNMKFKEVFGITTPTLPLRTGGNIVHGNAIRLDWAVICPKNAGDEVYVLGNPPFTGKKEQSNSQKEDLKHVFQSTKGNGVLDYVCNWFLLAAKYISSQFIEAAFVSTNSILQGEQVSILWKELFKENVKIKFAYKPFTWKNSAKNNASVHVVIVGLTKNNNSKKYIYTLNEGIYNLKREVENINPYLLEGNDIVVFRRSKPLSNIRELKYGSMPIDNGELIISQVEKHDIENEYPNASKYIRQLTGGFEFLNKSIRYCLWVTTQDLNEIEKIPPLYSKIIRCRDYRKASDRLTTKHLAKTPYSFGEIRQPKGNYIILPKISSDRREYIPIDFVESSVIVTGSALFIETDEGFMFSIVASKMFNVWVNCVCGRMKSDPQISASICYNTFSFPVISDDQKQVLERHVYRVLSERENHSEKTLAQLYNPDKMPSGLLEAHHQLDLAVERCYRSKPFETDEERLEYLFKLYEKNTTIERNLVF